MGFLQRWYERRGWRPREREVLAELRRDWADANLRGLGPSVQRDTIADLATANAFLERVRALVATHLESAEVVDEETFLPAETVTAPARALVAAKLGTTRLIDNLKLAAP